MLQILYIIAHLLERHGSTGDKYILYPGSGSSFPYSQGISANVLWNSVPNTTTHNWYISGTS